jgi:hypothetical protein
MEPMLVTPGEALKLFPAWLVLGPRQVGKSSLLQKCAAGDRLSVNLDDIDVRTRAQRDPHLFSRDLRLPLLIDEIQYAPQLLSVVKPLLRMSRPACLAPQPSTLGTRADS